MRHFLLTLFALILLAPAPADDYTAKVVGFSNGDTITVLKDRKQVRIRLNGIDAPEAKQDFGSRAKQLASDLAFGEAVTVSPVDTNRYGRTVGIVTLPDGRSLNREMVRQGMAWWCRAYAPKDREVAQHQAEARAAKRGLWSKPEPTPWEWRKGGKAAAQATEAGQVIGNRKGHICHTPN